MTTDEQRARDLLAAEYEKSGWPELAAAFREMRVTPNRVEHACINAITAALRQQRPQPPERYETEEEGDAYAHGFIDGMDEALRQQQAAFTNDGNSEARFIEDGERLNCPSCGGSGHVDDVKQEAPSDGDMARALESVAESFCELEVCARNASRATGIGTIEGKDLDGLRKAFGRLADSLASQQDYIRQALANPGTAGGAA